MKLKLDHTQRLNLQALLGAYRADVGSIRATWAIQDRIALDGPEDENIELKRETVAGQARNARSGIPRDRPQQKSSSLVTQRSPGSSQGGSPDVGFVRSSRRPALAHAAIEVLFPMAV